MRKTSFKYGKSLAITVGSVCAIFGRQNAANCSTVKRLIEKFNRTGSVANEKSSGRLRSIRPIEKIALVTASVGENLGTSIRCRAQQVAISQIVCREFERRISIGIVIKSN